MFACRHWRWNLDPQWDSLRHLFHDLVSDCYTTRLGVSDPEISSYVADLLTDFCSADNVYRVRDSNGQPAASLRDMLIAADPIHGTARSFGEEREVRKHIGDYSLFVTGMYPDSTHLWRRGRSDSFVEMVKAGKESYYIVSQFDLFEYAREAPFFARLASCFEHCIYGLNGVREELDRIAAFPASGNFEGGNPSPQRYPM